MGLEISSKQLGRQGTALGILQGTLATFLLTASNKWHIPGASPAGEPQKGRLERALLQLRSGWKIAPLLTEISPVELSPPFRAVLLEPLYSECSPRQHQSESGSGSEEPRTFSWAGADLGPNPL